MCLLRNNKTRTSKDEDINYSLGLIYRKSINSLKEKKTKDRTLVLLGSRPGTYLKVIQHGFSGSGGVHTVEKAARLVSDRVGAWPPPAPPGRPAQGRPRNREQRGDGQQDGQAQAPVRVGAAHRLRLQNISVTQRCSNETVSHGTENLEH
jgi:hypothetical protein